VLSKVAVDAPDEPREARVTHSPPGRRAPRARAASGAGPEQWLELPGWRRPLDTLLVLAVTFSAAWLGLVVIPAAANDGETPAAEKTAVASPSSADAPATPTVAETVAEAVAEAVAAATTTATATTDATLTSAPSTETTTETSSSGSETTTTETTTTTTTTSPSTTTSTQPPPE
jgi:hypothetical protein